MVWCMSPQVVFSLLQGCEHLEGLQDLGCEGGKADGLSSCLFPYLGHQVTICRHGVEGSAKGKQS